MSESLNMKKDEFHLVMERDSNNLIYQFESKRGPVLFFQLNITGWHIAYYLALLG